jgi:hypothetical protein
MTMNDRILDGLALIELSQRLGANDTAARSSELEALAANLTVADALTTATWLAGLIVTVAEQTGYPLAAYVADERVRAAK